MADPTGLAGRPLRTSMICSMYTTRDRDSGLVPSNIMVLLGAGVPITLLVDLLAGRGLDSAGILRSESSPECRHQLPRIRRGA